MNATGIADDMDDDGVAIDWRPKVPGGAVLIAVMLCVATLPIDAQVRPSPADPGKPRPANGMSFEEYEPRSTLRSPAHELTRARSPFVDVHGHQALDLTDRELRALVAEMDALNMRVMVNLSGTSGDRLRTAVANANRVAPGRFVFFANPDFRGLDEPGWSERAAAQFEQDVRLHGAAGLKIYKDLGLTLRDSRGRVPVDDPRLDALWSKAGELSVPVLIHTAEPAAFFQPVDRYNERWLELTQYPARARPPETYPTFDAVIAEQHRVFRRHPRTQFIAAHLGWLGHDLARLGATLDSIPNMSVDLAAVIYEIGRQPRFARQFLTRYQDRVLFGKDIYSRPEYYTYFRVLETEDDYFDYFRKRHAFWKMYGAGLPDTVLHKIYFENARRLIPRIGASGSR